MRYLVLLSSFLVLALLELPARATPPTDSAVSSLDTACQSACVGLAAELPTRTDVVSCPYAPFDAMPNTPACGSAREVLRLLCYGESSILEDNSRASTSTAHSPVDSMVHIIGDRRQPLIC